MLLLSWFWERVMGSTNKPHEDRLIIRHDDPYYVRRAYRVVLNELRIDLRDLPAEDWIFVLVAACDAEKLTDDEFKENVLAAMTYVAQRRMFFESP